jgi:hypothetical protein
MLGTKELAHGEETKEWLLKIDPKADWQLQIAALAHDIERAVPPKLKIHTDEKYGYYKARHAKRSATIVGQILRQEGFRNQDVSRIMNAIEKHEIGGDNDSDLVRDADSIRWFDKGHINYINVFGMDSAKTKGLWMYKRTTIETKRLIDDMPYENDIKEHISKKL